MGRKCGDYTSIPIDELPVLINPVLANDLRVVLEYTAPSRRWVVALAFTGITQYAIAETIGMRPSYLSHWLTPFPSRRTRATRLPLGAAFRLAKVLGQEVDTLFAAYF